MRSSSDDKRGNTRNRRARKLWMLWEHDLDLPPWNCRCIHCGAVLSYDTVQADRIIPGGSYRRENVQPSCAPCNIARGDNTNWIHPSRRLPAAA